MVIVEHKADFGLIDAHAEGVGGDDDVEFALHEPLLNLVPLRGRHATVIGLGGDVAVAQQTGQLRAALRVAT